MTAHTLKAVYDHFGISPDAAEHWVMRRSGQRLPVSDMSDDHIRNCLAIIFRDSGAPWPMPLKQYPATATLLLELFERGLLRPRVLMGSDWPWGDTIAADTYNAAVAVLPNFLPQQENAVRDSTKPTDNRSRTWARFKDMAAASGSVAKYGASYQLVKRLLDDYLKQWEPFLPEWATRDTSKAVAIWFFGAFVASSLEHEFFKDMPTKWVSSLAENAAYGAAGVLGADAFDVVWGLSGMLLGEVNKHLRGHGYEIDQDGNFRPASQLPMHDEAHAKEMEAMRAEREAMRTDLSEMRAMLESMRTDPRFAAAG